MDVRQALINIRSALGASHEDFSDFLGLPVSVIVGIEEGVLRLMPESLSHLLTVLIVTYEQFELLGTHDVSQYAVPYQSLAEHTQQDILNTIRGRYLARNALNLVL